MHLRKLTLLSITLLAAMTMLRCDYRDATRDLRFTLTFKNAKNLQPGQFVAYQGTTIGQVTSIDRDSSGLTKVDVTISEKYRSQIYEEASFTIENLELLNTSEKYQVVMTDRGNRRTPMQPSAVIAGNEGWLSDTAERFKRMTDAAKNAARSAAASAAEADDTGQ